MQIHLNEIKILFLKNNDYILVQLKFLKNKIAIFFL